MTATAELSRRDRQGEPVVSRDHEADPHFDLIELLFFAYRDFVADADQLLEDFGFGRAHHRVLYFVERRAGLTIAELLDILRVTKQSLNRVLKDLLEGGLVEVRSGPVDRRQRRLSATARGQELAWRLAQIQSRRIGRALAALPIGERPQASAFLRAMVGPMGGVPSGDAGATGNARPLPAGLPP